MLTSIQQVLFFLSLLDWGIPHRICYNIEASGAIRVLYLCIMPLQNNSNANRPFFPNSKHFFQHAAIITGFFQLYKLFHFLFFFLLVFLSETDHWVGIFSLLVFVSNIIWPIETHCHIHPMKNWCGLSRKTNRFEKFNEFASFRGLEESRRSIFSILCSPKFIFISRTI